MLNLELARVGIYDIRPGEVAELLDANMKSMRFNVLLLEPGDMRTINFHVSNTGNMAARLGDLKGVNPDPSTGVEVLWPALDHLIVMPGQSAGPYSIIVLWNTHMQDVPSGSVYFEANIVYAQT